MLPKLTILVMLATIVPDSLSGPTNAPNTTNSLLPKDPERFEALRGALNVLNISTLDFVNLVKTEPDALANSIIDFNSEFLKAVLDREDKRDLKNIVFSAFSIHTVLTAIYLATAADSASHKELANALGFQSAVGDKTYLANYYQVMRTYKRDPYLNVANGFFVNPDFPINSYFKNLLFGMFGAKPDVLDLFAGERQINNFVEQETDGQVKEMMPPRSVREGTEIVVVNALLHEGNWVVGFKEDLTGPMQWTLPNGKRVTYDYGMQTEKSEKIRYAEFDEYTVVEFCYKGSDNIKMFGVLPKKNDVDELNRLTRFFDIQEVERNLDYNRDGVCIYFPRLELTDDMDLIDIMKHMGVKKVFEHAEANLHVMTDVMTSITQVKTKVTVTIDEKGSKAASGAAAATCTRSNPDRIQFNRAFSVLIVDTDTGIVLFTARITKPTGPAKPSALPIAYPTKPQ